MKKIYSIISGILLTASVLAQAPQKMSYQAVIRNTSNALVISTKVGMRISILKGSATAIASPLTDYVETQTDTTNANGLVSLEIGKGTPVIGTFAGIKWAEGPYFIKTETDPKGGTNYTIEGANELLSVPYALYSGNALPSGGQEGQIITFCGGEPTWTTDGICGKIASLDCANTTNNGSLTQGAPANSISSLVSYTSGNGGPYNGQTIISTGVIGLTATLQAGLFANGNGTLTYTISGTPASAGTAIFAINIGGKSCTLAFIINQNVPSGQYPAGTVHCTNTPTAVVPVTNPTTGKIWMDRNLGATQVATSSTDAASYGDLYQWGRGADGHQCRISAISTTFSSTDIPGNATFILAPNAPNDWRSTQNNNLWQGVNGVNNPCPSGYRIPTDNELDVERVSWSANNPTGAFVSPLKLSLAGYRSNNNGSVDNVSDYGAYWSSTINGNYSRYLNFNNGNANVITFCRSFGYSVRCIKD
jgi:uncharacterized protein (TIGR02145 family)